MSFSILYEDGEALVINKPGGLPLDRPRRGGPALEDRLEELTFGFQRLPMPAHRLDTDTSGCLLLARNPKALKRFSAAFEERRVTKRYLGILDGVPEETEGTIELALSKISSEEAGWRMIPARRGKASVTHWKVLEVRDGLTLVEFRPETGRTHQIRVHAASGIGFPLLGDPVYGDGSKAHRTMLHASAIELDRPGKTPVSAVAPMPNEFLALGFTDSEAPMPNVAARPAEAPQGDDAVSAADDVTDIA